MILAAILFAASYAVLAPGLFLFLTALLAWETLRWLMLSALLLPVLGMLGLWHLLVGLPLIALLVGAMAARYPASLWPKLLLALLLPLGELLVDRGSGVSHLLGRLLPLLMDRRALFLLDTVAPVAASVLAALLVPGRLVRLVLGNGSKRNDQSRDLRAGAETARL